MAYIPARLGEWLAVAPSADGKEKWAKILMKDQKFEGGDTLVVVWEDWNDPEVPLSVFIANSENYDPENETLPVANGLVIDISSRKAKKAEDEVADAETEEEVEEEDDVEVEGEE